MISNIKYFILSVFTDVHRRFSSSQTTIIASRVFGDKELSLGRRFSPIHLWSVKLPSLGIQLI
jgi:hypothetical protein